MNSFTIERTEEGLINIHGNFSTSDLISVFIQIVLYSFGFDKNQFNTVLKLMGDKFIKAADDIAEKWEEFTHDQSI